MKRLLFLLLLLTVLCGCTVQESPPPREAVPAAVTEPVPPPPAVFPEPDIAPLYAAAADGTPLPTGCVEIYGQQYIKLYELLDALHVTTAYGFGFPWQGQPVAVEPGRAQVQLYGRTETLSAPVVEAGESLFIPVELCRLLGMRVRYDESQLRLYITSHSGSQPIPEGYTVPILMYHAVSDDIWGFADLFVSPAQMEEQLQYLMKNGFTPIHFSELSRVDKIQKPVILTFDDGYLDNYTELYPLLQKYGVKATIFVITDSVGSHEHYITWEQAKEMADSGLVEIQSHTASHPELHTRTAAEQNEEMARASLSILRNVGREPYVFSYPVGYYDLNTLSLVGQYYDFAVKMNGNIYVTGQNVFEMNRWYVPRGLYIGTFADMLGPS